LRSINAAEDAWNDKRGAWAQFGDNVLLGYEYRMCIKMARAKDQAAGLKDAFQRICIDIRTMKNCGEYGFYDVDPCYRLWVWKKNIKDANKDLKFT
jgi:hypothetical protein